MTNTQKQYPRGSFENRGESIEIPIVAKVSEYLLATILCTAIEGGVRYWSPKQRLHTEAKDEEGTHEVDVVVIPEPENDEVWDEYICRNVALGGSLTFYELDEVEDTLTPHKLTKEKLLAGLSKFLLGHRVSINTDDDGTIDFDYDAGDADSIVQYALFGKLVYG